MCAAVWRAASCGFWDGAALICSPWFSLGEPGEEALPWMAGAWPQKVLGSDGPLDKKLKTWAEDGVLGPPFIYQLSNLEKSTPSLCLLDYK